jgi:hypothetical protein
VKVWIQRCEYLKQVIGHFLLFRIIWIVQKVSINVGFIVCYCIPSLCHCVICDKFCVVNWLYLREMFFNFLHHVDI